jgi:hypothetical protein
MITSRQVDLLRDRDTLEDALSRDEFHRGTDVSAFFQPGTITNVYEDENGPIVWLRASRSLRIDMMFFDNADRLRNKEAMVVGFRKLVEGAKAAGFAEITTSTNSPALLKFATISIEDGGFGFEEVNVNGEVALRRPL